LNSFAAKGRLHFAGEALSVRHAWVVGALDSAWRAVHEYLLLTNADVVTLNKFFGLWGYNQEWTKSSPAFIPEKQKFSPLNDLLLEHILLTHPELY